MNLVCCVAAAVALGVLSACRPLLSEESRVIDSPMRVSFESLGWTEGVLVSADSGPAEVRFLLPDSPVQGDPLWYGARLSYEWTGNPGNPGHDDDGGDDYNSRINITLVPGTYTIAATTWGDHETGAYTLTTQK